MMPYSYDVIKKPRITEKGSRLKEQGGVLTFVVRNDANKIQIKAAIEGIFNVKVTDITTVRNIGKKKRMGQRIGVRSDWKKAYVTLKAGDKIEVLEGA